MGVIPTASATRRIVTASAPSFSKIASATQAIFSAVLSAFILYNVYYTSYIWQGYGYGPWRKTDIWRCEAKNVLREDRAAAKFPAVHLRFSLGRVSLILLSDPKGRTGCSKSACF